MQVPTEKTIRIAWKKKRPMQEGHARKEGWLGLPVVHGRVGASVGEHRPAAGAGLVSFGCGRWAWLLKFGLADVGPYKWAYSWVHLYGPWAFGFRPKKTLKIK